jgi:hypothetical protein
MSNPADFEYDLTAGWAAGLKVVQGGSERKLLPISGKTKWAKIYKVHLVQWLQVAVAGPH